MADLTGFNANEYEAASFDVLPAGDYDVVIVESDLKETKAKNGHYLELVLQVINGPFQNRKLWARLNVKNPSEKCQAIGKGQLAEICRAVGVLTPGDSVELHNKPFKVKVKVGQDDKGNDTNEVTGFKPRHAGAATSSTKPASQTQPQLGESGIAPPLAGAGTSGKKSPWG